CTTDRFYFDYW
nr:immunoglobulin heavy chain junction region [Mus musculus]